jgi:hypothetical protein
MTLPTSPEGARALSSVLSNAGEASSSLIILIQAAMALSSRSIVMLNPKRFDLKGIGARFVRETARLRPWTR